MFNWERLEIVAVKLTNRLVAALLLHNYFNSTDGVGIRANAYKEMLKELKK